MAAAKTDSGLGDGEPPSLDPLTEDHFAADPEVAQRVVLNSLSDAKYANRLAVGQTLSFIVDGLTVIYGDNGSGKSGYCRLLKKLCRVCDGADETILLDAFRPAPPGPAEVKVRFTVGDGQPSEMLWRDRTSPPPALRQVSVFDSRAAPLYVNRDNKVEYLPFGLDLLPRLGGVCQELATRLDSEIRAMERACSAAISGFQSDTDAGLAVAHLQLHTPAQSLPTATELRELGSWTLVHAQRLGELAQELDHDATVLAVLLDRAADAATALAAMVSAALPRLGDAGLERPVASEQSRDIGRWFTAESRTTAAW